MNFQSPPLPHQPHRMMTPPTLRETTRWRGLRVGLFGGTFNPPHIGHVHASEIAMTYLGLDAVWWLVTPGNPLKSKSGLPSLSERISACRDLVKHPKIIISDIEQDLGTIRTFDTVKALQKRFPMTDFIWFSGTDIAYEFPKWYKWQELQTMIPFAFVGRPNKSGLVRQNSFRMNARLTHIYPQHGITPKLEKGQIYWIFAEPQMDISSSRLRGSTSGFAPPIKKG